MRYNEQNTRETEAGYLHSSPVETKGWGRGEDREELTH